MQRMTLLCDGGLITSDLPLAVAANPDPSVAIRAAEIFAKLVAFNVSAGGDHGGIAVHPYDHIRDIHGFVAELAAAAGGDRFRFGRDLAERSNRDIVLGEGAQGKVGVAAEAGFFGLALHVDDLANGFLVGGIEARSGVNGDVLRGKCRQGREHAKQ